MTVGGAGFRRWMVGACQLLWHPYSRAPLTPSTTGWRKQPASVRKEEADAARSPHDQPPPSADAGAVPPSVVEGVSGAIGITDATAATDVPDSTDQTTGIPTEGSTTNDDAMERLRSSTAKLTQTLSTKTRETAADIDERYHLRESVSQGVANLDSNYHIKERTSSLWSTVRGSISQVGGSITASAGAVGSSLGVDSAQVSTRTAEVTASVTQKVKGVSSEIGNAVREGTKQTGPAREAMTDRFGDKLSKVGEVVGGIKGSVRNMDEQYGISTKAAETLAGGADLLSKSLGGDNNTAASATAPSSSSSSSSNDDIPGPSSESAAAAEISTKEE